MSFINNLYFKFRHYFSHYFPKIYCLCEKHKRVVKFFIAGSVAGISDLIFLYILHGLLKVEIVMSTSIAFILAFLISFTLQKFWTFRNYSRQKMFNQLFLYILNAVIGLSLNGLFMHLLVNGCHVWYIFSQIIVNLLIGFLNFLIYKFIIFRIGRNETCSEHKAINRNAGTMA